jgi:hypothetical protein
MNTDQLARAALLKLRSLAEPSTSGVYGDRIRALTDIDSILASPDNAKIKFLLAPTGNLQELSMDNGWGSEFCSIAAELEHILGLN